MSYFEPPDPLSTAEIAELENVALCAVGVGRDGLDARGLWISFNRSPTDDEMRAIHDLLRDPERPAVQPGEQPEAGDEALARAFHEAYERLAPSFGYETRAETRQFDPTSKNGRLMVAVCGEIMRRTFQTTEGQGK